MTSVCRQTPQPASLSPSTETARRPARASTPSCHSSKPRRRSGTYRSQRRSTTAPSTRQRIQSARVRHPCVRTGARMTGQGPSREKWTTVDTVASRCRGNGAVNPTAGGQFGVQLPAEHLVSPSGDAAGGTLRPRCTSDSSRSSGAQASPARAFLRFWPHRAVDRTIDRLVQT